MGSSFTDFKNYGFWARDAHLDLWLYLLVREIDRLEPKPRWLKEANDDWYEQATMALTGCISPRLDNYLVSQDKIDLVIMLSERALKLLSEQKGYINGAYLNSLSIGGGGYQPNTDFEIENFVAVGQKFIELLRGELRTDASTSPVF